MSEISTLSPRRVWEFFDLVCSVPHPSGYEASLAEKLADVAREYGLSCRQDNAGNLRIDRPAAPGFESLPGIIVQAHLDMVPVAEDENFDFTVTPITAYIDNGVVRAQNTTLGADDGAGIALAMALLTDPELKCGPLSALFTIGEETGLVGAAALDPDMLEGKYLFNLDGGDVGEAIVGCAGGARQEFTFRSEYIDRPAGVSLSVALTGLPGGHSGECIDKNRGNAIKSLASFLLEQSGVSVASFNAGNADNAIPHEARAEIVFSGDMDALNNSAALFALLLNKELACDSVKLEIVRSNAGCERVWSGEFQQRLLSALSLVPNGVFENDTELGIVKTSSNLAAVFTEENFVRVRSSQRSLDDDEREKASAMLATHFEMSGASSEVSSPYPGWKPQPECRLVCCCAEVWQELHKQPLHLSAIHAGLEAGVFGKKNPELELISLGPGAPGCHTPREYLVIENMGMVYDFLKAVIAALSES